MRLERGWEVGVYIGSTNTFVPTNLYPYDKLATRDQLRCNYTISQYSSFSLARWSGIENTALNQVGVYVTAVV